MTTTVPATPPLARSMIAQLGGQVSRPPIQYSHSRFPYTYAWDYVRECLPGSVSRGEASRIVGDWCEEHNTNKDSMAVLLACEYMNRYGIEVPAS